MKAFIGVKVEVSLLTFYADYSSSTPAKVILQFLRLNFVLDRPKINKRRPGLDHQKLPKTFCKRDKSIDI